MLPLAIMDGVIVVQQALVGEAVRAVFVQDGVVIEGPIVVDSGALDQYGDTLVLLPENSAAVAGWRYTNGEFLLPLLSKLERLAVVDARTQEILDQGFKFRGQWMSMSTEAQNTLRDSMDYANVYSYPLYFITLDEQNSVAIESKEALLDLYNSCFGHKLSVILEGDKVKAAVLAAQTLEEWNNVVDSR